MEWSILIKEHKYFQVTYLNFKFNAMSQYKKLGADIIIIIFFTSSLFYIIAF